jgi:hypothetical protein
MNGYRDIQLFDSMIKPVNTPLLKKSSNNNDSGRGFLLYADVMSPRNTLWKELENDKFQL